MGHVCWAMLMPGATAPPSQVSQQGRIGTLGLLISLGAVRSQACPTWMLTGPSHRGLAACRLGRWVCKAGVSPGAGEEVSRDVMAKMYAGRVETH